MYGGLTIMEYKLLKRFVQNWNDISMDLSQILIYGANLLNHWYEAKR